MTEKAKAWIFTGIDKKLDCIGIPLPELGTGEILIKNVACSICKSDLHTFSGTRPGLTPSILGHEIVGEIVGLPEQPIFDYWRNELKLGNLISKMSKTIN